MEKSRIEIFTSPTCPHCPGALELAREVEREREDVEVVELSTLSEEGRTKAQEFGVMSVPTIFVKGPKHGEILGFRGAPSKERLIKAVEISLGLKKAEELE